MTHLALDQNLFIWYSSKIFSGRRLMKEGKYSYTAEASAAMRALGTYEKDNKLRNPDYLAERLIGWRFRLLLSFGLLRRLALSYAGRKFPGLYEGHLSRTHYYDTIVKEELEKGIRQYVILGAGLDTRPYRFASQASGCRIFEVDFPATSQFKKNRLQETGIPTDHVTYVEVDFTKEKAQGRLLEEGFKKDAPTLFTWEGVIMYLNDESVTEVLSLVASLPSGSSIIFDYFFQDVITNPEKFREAGVQMDYLKKINEPYTFGVNWEDMEKYVSDKGLILVENLGPGKLSSQYLPGHHRGVVEWYGIARARVP